MAPAGSSKGTPDQDTMTGAWSQPLSIPQCCYPLGGRIKLCLVWCFLMEQPPSFSDHRDLTGARDRYNSPKSYRGRGVQLMSNPQQNWLGGTCSAKVQSLASFGSEWSLLGPKERQEITPSLLSHVLQHLVCQALFPHSLFEGRRLRGLGPIGHVGNHPADIQTTENWMRVRHVLLLCSTTGPYLSAQLIHSTNRQYYMNFKALNKNQKVES